MTVRPGWLVALVLASIAAGCGNSDRSRETDPAAELSPDQREAEALGKEIFDLVDRAIDYRGSHRGRPAVTLKQMGIESLTTATVRRVVNLQQEPVITAAYRRTAGREIVSCRGDSHILEEAMLNAGRFTLMCTASSGDQRPMQVGERAEH
jgi:hypothetical protein